MELLNDEELNWLIKNHSKLTYLEKARLIIGKFEFTAKYRNLETISDAFDLIIKMNYGQMLPSVYETSGRIQKMAKILNVPLSELHVNYDGTICLIRPDKIFSIYPKGMNIKDFMQHLTSHFYWVSYFYQYGRAPWLAEKHGWHL